MAGDEILLELLHAELVSYVTQVENKNLKVFYELFFNITLF